MFFIKRILILLFISSSIYFVLKESDYIEIPPTSIRMRVIANSNSIEDIQHKNFIKDILEDELYSLTKNEKDIDKIDEILNNNKTIIDNHIIEKMKENNIMDSYNSNYGLNYFPEKKYQNITYKAGKYKSFVVKLGEAKGNNWWCVLYPPICLLEDNNNSDYEIKFLIKELLNKYN